MVAQTLQKEDQSRDILVAHDINAEVRLGSNLLIQSHRAGAKVDIKSWGTADTVYEDVTAQLMAYGMQQGVAQNYTRSLVDYAVAHADDFRSEHNANIIALRVTVAEMNPAAQFETGPVATFRLNGNSRQAEMASASGQNVRSTISGTATTTSDRSSVENVWQGVKEWSVWGKMEAPDKSELAGQTPALIAVALAQMADGALTPAEAATLQAQLEALAQEGLIVPELADIVRAVETMRAMMEGGMDIDASMVQPQVLADYISGLIEQGVENGNLPPELARQVMESIASFSDAYGLEQIFTGDMMQSLSATIEWTATTQALGDIMPHLSAESRAVIEAMLERGEVPSGDVLAEQIATINDIIAQADLPESVAEHVAILGQSTATLQDIAQSQSSPASADLSVSQASLDSTSLSASDIQKVIATMDGVDLVDLTLEQAAVIEALQEAMGTVDLSNVTPEQISAVLKGAEYSEVTVAIQALAVTMSNPQMAELRSPAVETSITSKVLEEKNASLPSDFSSLTDRVAEANVAESDAGQAVDTGANVIDFHVVRDPAPNETENVTVVEPEAGPDAEPEVGLDPNPDIAPEVLTDPVRPSEVDKNVPVALPDEAPVPENDGSELEPELEEVVLPPDNNPPPSEPERKQPESAPVSNDSCGDGCKCLEDFKEAATNDGAAPHPLTPEEKNQRTENEIKQKADAIQSQAIGVGVQNGDLVVTRLAGDAVAVTDSSGKRIGFYKSPEVYARELALDEERSNKFVRETRNLKRETVVVSINDFSPLPHVSGGGLTPQFNGQEEGFTNIVKRSRVADRRKLGLG